MAPVARPRVGTAKVSGFDDSGSNHSKEPLMPPRVPSRQDGFASEGYQGGPDDNYHAHILVTSGGSLERPHHEY